jgi:DNA helicase II / ATP-dependent DNA helicase PcrA
MILSTELTLSDVQKRVIDHDKGHLRIVACPGSGKTEVVSRRVAELIKKGVDPSTIVAFTFTEKAAEGLKLRIRKRLEESCPEKSNVGDMYIGTIDSFCLHILKQLKPEFRSFEVLDSARRIAFIDRWYYRMGFRDLQGEKRGKWATMRMFCDSADRVMMERIDTSKISNEEFVKCYDEYVKKLKEERFFDFSSIIFSLLNLLKTNTDALKQLKETVKHVVFDEYQDVNKLQEELLEYLSMGADSICVVGDDDQNIFQWRGSDVDYIINFPDAYAKYGVTTEQLDINYRATNGLVETADNFIRNNTYRVSKNMQAYEKQNRKFETGDIVHHHFDTDTEEFEFLLQNIQNLHNTDFIDKHGETFGLSYGDMAILVSSNEDAARILKFFDEHDVPCIADSGSSVFDRPIVSFATDCICYVFSCNGYTTGDDIPELDSLLTQYSSIIPSGDVKKFEKNLLEIKNRADIIIAKGNSDWLPNLGLQEFYQRLLSAMGTEEGLINDSNLYHLAVLSAAISDYTYVYQTLRAREVSGLKWFIVQFAESNYSDPRHNDPTLLDAVRVLTIWKAKGLEFPVVFVPTFVSKRKPPPWKNFVDDHLYDNVRYAGDKEDDRRAYYTAITRSQKYLFLTGAKQRQIVVKNKPSKNEIKPHLFLDEMRNERFSELSYVEKPKSKKKPVLQTEGTFPTSYSDLSIYNRCPYDYKLRSVMGFVVGIPAAFGYGLNIHNILNLIHSNYIQHQKIPTTTEIEKTFDDMFYLRFAPGMQNETMKNAGSKVVKSYVELHKEDFKRILETEKRFEFVMGKALIAGDIDLLKKVNDKGEITEIEIIDFKTDKQKDDGKYEQDHSEQVRFYAYATRMSLGYKPEKALIHHLDTHEKDYVDISDGKLDETKARIEQKVDRIISRDFDASPEKIKCEGCDFRALCPHKEFDVGVNFKPAKSAKNSGSMRKDDDIDEELESIKRNPLKPSIVSASIMKKAEKIAKGTIKQINDNSFQITSSSDPDKSYTVTATTCQCKGYRNYSGRNPGTIPTCSHIEGIKIYKKLKTS